MINLALIIGDNDFGSEGFYGLVNGCVVQQFTKVGVIHTGISGRVELLQVAMQGGKPEFPLIIVKRKAPVFAHGLNLQAISQGNAAEEVK